VIGNDHRRGDFIAIAIDHISQPVQAPFDGEESLCAEGDFGKKGVAVTPGEVRAGFDCRNHIGVPEIQRSAEGVLGILLA
jgi:hypothetical protein